MLITRQPWEGTQSSTLLAGGTSPGTPIQAPDDNNDLDVTPGFGLILELMTPELPLGLDRIGLAQEGRNPRLFVGGELIVLSGIERTLAREGDPGVIRPPSSQGATFGEDFFLGLGAKTTAEMSEIGWGAYAGISFPFEIYDRIVRIKPNVSWMRYRVQFKGILADGECSLADCSLPANFTRLTALEASASKTFHGLGPGLDVELETGDFFGLGSTIFVGFRSYKILNATDVEFASSETFNDAIGTGDVATARFTAEVDDWLHRFLFGFRLEWHGLGQGRWWNR
jgi:hypothetical protein